MNEIVLVLDCFYFLDKEYDIKNYADCVREFVVRELTIKKRIPKGDDLL